MTSIRSVVGMHSLYVSKEEQLLSLLPPMTGKPCRKIYHPTQMSKNAGLESATRVQIEKGETFICLAGSNSRKGSVDVRVAAVDLGRIDAIWCDGLTSVATQNYLQRGY